MEKNLLLVVLLFCLMAWIWKPDSFGLQNKAASSSTTIKVISQSCRVWANLSGDLFTPQEIILSDSMTPFEFINVSPTTCNWVAVSGGNYQDLNPLKLILLNGSSPLMVNVSGSDNFDCNDNENVCLIGQYGKLVLQGSQLLPNQYWCFAQYGTGQNITIRTLDSTFVCV